MDRPGTGRVLVQNFPMAAMPDEVKKKATGRLADFLRDAATAHPPAGAIKVDIADAGSGDVMATVVPSTARPRPSAAAGPEPTPFQADVEKAFRGHQIMGPRIVRFEWTAPGTGRVLVQNFPMAGMPDEVKTKFTGRLADYLRDAAKAHPPGGDIKIDIADAGSGDVHGDGRPVVLATRVGATQLPTPLLLVSATWSAVGCSTFSCFFTAKSEALSTIA
jgi:hypothetical protein